ncbi:putative HD superfamily hydrolase involved in NAD metabolism [Scopulibacillus darangshiensis]|uniref:bis(5'-nucleosyl)-tetraphosphatase (symmetrical) n=1 Tax=Scopulibacillus darangshiensis TaxID=442528 RepID=A0A4R2PCY6_9BACL|nr:bis(5'-nucleosyl)-tetraphosphatase (symmetrical) YqeK [Scopulibacillus darangshiensis]TCP32318.1 putative HD superfamily hydrolase involved in NAD metabolism [Scopulibacillus darangshiensis]
MKIEEAQKIVKGILPAKRFDHTLGVVEAAQGLAKRFNGDIDKAGLAAMLHDIAKYFSKTKMAETIRRRNDIADELLQYHLSLWHASVGAVYAEEELNITDHDILEAMKWHTTGKKDMTLLDKIVFLADYIEPGRNFPGVDEVRATAEKSLDLACAKALENTIVFLVARRQQIHPDTIYAYNDLIEKTRKKVI